MLDDLYFHRTILPNLNVRGIRVLALGCLFVEHDVFVLIRNIYFHQRIMDLLVVLRNFAWGGTGFGHAVIKCFVVVPNGGPGGNQEGIDLLIIRGFLTAAYSA